MSVYYHLHFCIIYSLREDERILSLQESMQLSERVNDNHSHISIAMQVEFVSLGGRTMLEPVINMVRYDRSLVSDTPRTRQLRSISLPIDILIYYFNYSPFCVSIYYCCTWWENYHAYCSLCQTQFSSRLTNFSFVSANDY